MKFAKIVFLVAGIYGVLLVTPQYFTKSLIGHWFPPAVNHPEYYFGFVGSIVVWHLLFLVMAGDPARYRALMPVCALEKAAFGLPVLALVVTGRAAGALIPAAVIDLVFGALFLASYAKLGETLPISTPAKLRTSK